MAVYKNKIDKPLYVGTDSHFTSKANVSLVNDGDYAIVMAEDILILDNNISIKNTRDNDEHMTVAVWAAADTVTSLTANNSAKKISSVFTATTRNTIFAYGILGMAGLNITGKKFLYTINVSANNVGNAAAYGINFNGINSSANISKAVTVSATATGNNSSAMAFGISSALSEEGTRNMTLQNGVSGAISVTAVSKTDTAVSCAFDSINLRILGNVTSKITSSATGKSLNQRVTAYGFYAYAITIENFNATLTVKAKNTNTSYASGIEDIGTGTQIYGGKNGKINIAAESTNGDATAYGFDGSDILFANFACTLQVSATSKNNDASAYGVSSKKDIAYVCDISKNITINAKNTRATVDHSTNACAFLANEDIAAYNISATILVSSSNEGDAMASGFEAGKSLSFADISGNLNIKTVNKEHYGKGISQAIIARSEGGSFTAGIISGKLTAAATDGSAVAVGVYSGTSVAIKDMAKSQVTVTASSKNGTAFAWGIRAGAGNMIVDYDGLNFGNITVSATSGAYFNSAAYGIFLNAGSITSQTNVGQKLSGKITVKSNGDSIGIFANSIEVSSAVNLTVTGKNAAYAYQLGYAASNLWISEAKVIAKTSDKSGVAYSVYAFTGTYAQNVFIADKSTVIGNIDLAGGNDAVYIESGSKLKGALNSVENVILDISDRSNYSLWDIVNSADEMSRANLEIDFDYGMTGNFLICTKESSLDWSDAIQNGIDLSFDGGAKRFTDLFQLDKRTNTYSDSFYSFELKTNGNKMILAVSEII